MDQRQNIKSFAATFCCRIGEFLRYWRIHAIAEDFRGERPEHCSSEEGRLFPTLYWLV
jgi:hypothetical protein